MPTTMMPLKLPGSIEKVDLHTHIIPETWPDWNKEFGYEGWLTIKHDSEGVIHRSNMETLIFQSKLLNCDGSVFRRIHENCWCPHTRLEECDRTNVTLQVVRILFLN